MLERIIIVGLLISFGLIAYYLFTKWHLAKVTKQLGTDPILVGLNHDLPTIIYFTTPNCLPCKTQQQPALQRLGTMLNVQIVKIDAAEEAETAERWGVMTAPTTFVLDRHWQPKAVNYGVADEAKLFKQINDAMQLA